MRYLSWGLKVLLSVALLYFVLSRFALAAIWAHVREANLLWLLLALSTIILNCYLLGLRWSRLSLGLVSPRQAMKYTLVGFFFGALMPGAVSGDIAKGFSLAFKDKTARHILLPTSIVLDKLLGLGALVLLFIPSVFLMTDNPSSQSTDLRTVLRILAVAALAGLVLLGILYWLLLTNRYKLRLPGRRLQSSVNMLNAIPELYRSQPAVVLSALGIGVIIHLSNAAGYLFILKSMAIVTPVYFAVVLYSILSFVTMAPISISGIGVRDLTAAALFAGLGLSREAGVAFTWELLGISIPVIIVGGLIQSVDFLRTRRIAAGGSPAPKPVIHIVDNLAFGGCQTLLRSLAMHPSNERPHYFIVLRRHQGGVTLPESSTIVCRTVFRYSPFPFFHLLKLVRRTGPAILHCHLFKSQLLGLLVSRFEPSCELIFHEHGRLAGREFEPFWELPLYRVFLRWTGSSVNRFIAISKGMLEHLTRLGVRGRQPSIVIYNGILDGVHSCTPEQRAAARSGLNLPQDSIVLGFAGRIVERKGWREFLAAAGHYRHRTDVLWVVAGSGPEESQLRDLIRQQGLTNLRLLGFQSDMARYYCALDGCIIPSHWEPHGLVQIEAQSYGLPVLASNVTGMAETLHDGQDALLFQPRDATSLVRQVERLLSEPELRRQLTIGALENARHFTIDRYHAELEAVYRDLENPNSPA